MYTRILFSLISGLSDKSPINGYTNPVYHSVYTLQLNHNLTSPVWRKYDNYFQVFKGYETEDRAGLFNLILQGQTRKIHGKFQTGNNVWIRFFPRKSQAVCSLLNVLWNKEYHKRKKSVQQMGGWTKPHSLNLINHSGRAFYVHLMHCLSLASSGLQPFIIPFAPGLPPAHGFAFFPACPLQHFQPHFTPVSKPRLLSWLPNLNELNLSHFVCFYKQKGKPKKKLTQPCEMLSSYTNGQCSVGALDTT